MRRRGRTSVTIPEGGAALLDRTLYATDEYVTKLRAAIPTHRF